MLLIRIATWDSMLILTKRDGRIQSTGDMVCAGYFFKFDRATSEHRLRAPTRVLVMIEQLICSGRVAPLHPFICCVDNS